jgi:hypothetical protein
MRQAEVIVVPFDPGWPAAFESLQTVLAAALGEIARALAGALRERAANEGLR